MVPAQRRPLLASAEGLTLYTKGDQVPLIAILAVPNADLERQPTVFTPVAAHRGAPVVAGGALRSQIHAIGRVPTEEIAQDMDRLAFAVRPPLPKQDDLDAILDLVQHSSRICLGKRGLDSFERIVGLNRSRSAQKQHPDQREGAQAKKPWQVAGKIHQGRSDKRGLSVPEQKVDRCAPDCNPGHKSAVASGSHTRLPTGVVMACPVLRPARQS